MKEERKQVASQGEHTPVDPIRSDPSQSNPIQPVLLLAGRFITPVLFTYLNIRHVNVGVVVTILNVSCLASVVGIDIDREALCRVVCAAQHEVVVSLCDARCVLDTVRDGVIIILLVLFILVRLLQVRVHICRNVHDICSDRLVAALFVTLVEHRKDNHVNVITVCACVCMLDGRKEEMECKERHDR